MYKLDIYVRNNSFPIQSLEDIVREWFYKDKAEYALVNGRYASPKVNYFNIHLNICGFKRRIRTINDCTAKEIEDKLVKIFKEACFTTEHDLYKCGCSKKDFTKAQLSIYVTGAKNSKAHLSYERQVLIYKMVLAGKLRKDVARALNVSAQTVKDAYRRIKYAIEHGQINVD